MRTKVIAGVGIAVAVLCWAGSTHGQVQSVPGPGSGIVTVDVRRLPPVDVVQRGDWKVALADVADVKIVNTPTVVTAPLAFLKAGGRYEVTWPAGDRETIAVAQLGHGGWVRAAVDGRRRWLNLSLARAIDEMP